MGEQILAEQAVGVPAPPLRRLVTRYIGYRYQGYAPGVHAGLPSRHLTLVASVGDPVDVGVMHDAAAPRARYDALAGGLHTAPAAIHHNGSEHGVQLEVTPQGARALFGVRAAEITALTLPLDDLLGRLTAELLDRLHAADTWSRRFAALDQILVRASAEVPEPAPEVTWVWDRLAASDGAVAIGRLASEVGWSRRHLSARFRHEFGLPPKTMARVMRFERARRLLTHLDHPSLGGVALAAGYADQAHMTRDWRELAGAPPAAWLAAELFPFVQDDTGDRPSDSLP